MSKKPSILLIRDFRRGMDFGTEGYKLGHTLKSRGERASDGCDHGKTFPQQIQFKTSALRK